MDDTEAPPRTDPDPAKPAPTTGKAPESASQVGQNALKGKSPDMSVAKPVAKAVVRKAVAKATVTKAVAKRPAAKTTVLRKTVAKAAPPRPSKPRVAKAVVKAAPRKTPATKTPTEPPVTKSTPAIAPAAAPSAPAAKTSPPAPQAGGGEAKSPIRIVARPDMDPHNMMRQALKAHEANRLDDAQALYNRILQHDPEFAAAWINLGVLLRRIGRLSASVTCLTRGVSLKPDDGPAWSNLGNALRAVNRLDDALMAQRRALELSPEVARIHYNYGLTMRDSGNLAEGIAALRRSALLGYDAPELAWDSSLTKLISGDLKSGFEEYESRWNLPEISRMHHDIPAWDGAPLNGRNLLVWSEQGLGDTIQFCRYLIDSADGLKTGTSKIVLEVQPPLVRILQRSPVFNNITVVSRGSSLPEVDLQVPLLSLPRICGTDPQNIPDHCPYITAPMDIAPPEISQTASVSKKRLKVGICWAGKPSHRNDRNRSIGLAQFATLFDLPRTDFISLQKGPAVTDINDMALGALVRDAGTQFRDFADTSAAIRSLDLIITVDTSVAHLAGAMARPVWVLLPYAPDWRWMLHRDDSPWYPSMTLYRQTSPGDWDEVITRVRNSLARKLKNLG